ncbi:hypothetical protein UlMin_010754 [Ulmus minor]
MEVNAKLTQEDGDDLEDAIVYRRLIGKLLYLTLTKPNISYSINRLSQFLVQPKTSHIHAAKRVLQYLKGSPGHGIFYPVDSKIQIKCFADSDWGRCTNSRRSVTGFCVFIGDSLVSWK